MLLLWLIIMTIISTTKSVAADHKWELAVAVSDKIDLINRTGYIVDKFDVPNGLVTTLTYDPKHEEIYFTNNNNSEYSIYRLNLSHNNTGSHYKPIIKKQPSGNITSLAFDTFNRTLYWAVGHEIKYLKLDYGVELPSNGTVLHTFNNTFNPIDLTVDVCDSTLYWTNQFYYNNYTLIQKTKLNGGREIVNFRQVQNKAYGIVVDQSAGLVYWSGEEEGSQMYIKSLPLYANSTKENVVISDSNGHRPISLAVIDSQCYWTDIISNKFYTAEKTDNGKNKVLSLSMHTKKAYDVKVFGIISLKQNSIIYPKDCGRISTVTKQDYKIDPVCVRASSDEKKFVERNGKKMALCSDNINSDQSECLGRYCRKESRVTDKDLCYNYCLNKGECSITDNKPKCNCKNNWAGERCEIDPCVGYCHNDGICSLNNGNKKCICNDEFKGDRCEQHVALEQYACFIFCNNLMNISAVEVLPSPDIPLAKLSSCSCSTSSISQPVSESPHGDNESWLLPAVIVLAILCVLLMATTAVLISKVLSLRKRPRIKKRIIVNKNVTPLTARPQAEQCEITIENCCNMNICETPCFEPDFRRPSSTEKTKKEEKKSLLTSIDLPPDDLY